MHKLLERQVAKAHVSVCDLPHEWRSLIAAVESSYCEADDDRAMLERTMEIASAELVHRYELLQAAHEATKCSERDLIRVLSVFDATLESSANGILVVDCRGIVERSNRRLTEMWNLPADVVAGDHDAAVKAVMSTQVEDPDDFLATVETMRAHPGRESFDVVRLRDKRVLERHSRPYFIARRIAGRIVSFRDVTARRLLEEELRQSQKMDAVGQLAGGMAHDFNNLLTVISLRSELVREPAGPPHQLPDAITEIVHAAERAAGLTRQLLAFSRRQVLQLVNLDMNHLATSMEPMLRRLIGDEIAIATVVTRELAVVRADRTQLEQIVLNLVVNARDAMPQGGRISIEIANGTLPHHLDPGHGTRGDSADCVILSVSDNGQGIPLEARDHVFEPFFTTKSVGTGTGLGLATVHGIIAQLGGHITLESEIAVGTTFRIYLPRVRSTAVSEGHAIRNQESQSGCETVLLVEDEQAVRGLARRVLSGHGYSVLVARHGRDALRVVADFPGRIDLVVTDLVMPDMGGQELVTHLRRQHADLPVLLMSGYSDAELDLSSLGEFDTAFLPKPFDGTSLTTAVRRLLDRRIVATATAPVI